MLSDKVRARGTNTPPQAQPPRSLRQWQRRWTTVGLVGLPVIAVLVVWQLWFPGQAFDPIAWRDKGQVQQGVRLAMADRLIAQGTFQDKTRAQVVEMLGEPPSTEYFRDWDLVYWLGPERGFMSIDSEWLVFRLNAEDRVVEYRIVRD